MKKIFTFVAALAITMMANAQVAKLGFEIDDAKYTTEEALTPVGIYGDWVNVKEIDTWNEGYSGEAHSGEYCLYAENGDEAGTTWQSWDRGFKLGNLQIKDNTPYRVSFWVKADPTYLDADGAEQNTKLMTHLSIGIENYDNSFVTPSVQDYASDITSGMTGEWKRITYNAFYTNKELQNKAIESKSWIGSDVYPGGDGETYREHFNNEFPDKYFLIINMYSPGTYLLDDILVEESSFGSISFNYDCIKIDFGYPTNIADLAKASIDGYAHFDPSLIQVMLGDKALNVELLEGHKDGYLYAFVSEDDISDLSDADEIIVSLKTPEEIVYNTEKRPAPYTEGDADMPAVSFFQEVGVFDVSVDELSSIWSPAKLVSTTPEDGSFELESASLKSVSFTFDKTLFLDYASASLLNNGIASNLTSGMKLSDDEMTVIVALPTLADGEYTVRLSGVCNSAGMECDNDQTLTFEIGESSDDSKSETIYASDFDNDMTDGIPPGWLTENEAGIHLYGFNDEEQTSQYNYGWGGNPGGGGARLYAGFSGDFNKAMYWGTRGTELGYASYGELVKDYFLADGSLDPEMPDNIALKLEARKYQVSFLMAAWKGEPTFSFTLEDLNGEVYCKFDNYLAAPNMNGATGAVSGTVKCTADFTVPKDGYYVLKFVSTPAQWQEFLLANVNLISMPSKAAYYHQLLDAAIEDAETVLANCSDVKYDGESKTALIDEIAKAKAGGFHQPSEIDNEIAALKAAAAKLQARADNIETYDVAIGEAAQAVESLAGTKYTQADAYVEVAEVVNQYKDTEGYQLSDEELARVTPIITSASAKLSNLPGCTDLLTYGLRKAADAAVNLSINTANISAVDDALTDDRDLAAALNGEIKDALYSKIANNEDLSELMVDVYADSNQDAEGIHEDDPNWNEDGYEKVITGIDLTGYIMNPNMYCVGSAPLNNETIPGWQVDQAINGNGSVGINGDAATAEKPVTNPLINNYGASNYKFWQEVEDLPVGIYSVVVGTRTGTTTDADGNPSTFNAYCDSLQVWDKYMFVQVDDQEQVIAPFIGGGEWKGYITYIPNVNITKPGQKLSFGVVENYVSGLAQKQGSPTDYWDTNTFVKNAYLYFTGKDASFNYATGIETITENNAKKFADGKVYNVAGQVVDANFKGIVIKNGSKYLQK